MAARETFSLIAELALGLAGFTGVLVVLGRQPGRFSSSEAFRLGVLLVGALSALFLSLVPLVLSDFGVSGCALWRTSSALMAAAIVCAGTLLAGPLRRFRADRSEAYSPWVLGSVLTGALAVSVLQTLNAAGALGSPSSGPFSLGLVYLLAGSVVQFVRILFVRT